MWVELPAFWIVALNVLYLPAAQLGIARIFTSVSLDRFSADSALFRKRRWERGGRLYESAFAVRRWKGSLPDGARWFGGFSKGGLAGRDVTYLERFRAETRRGEAAHLVQIPAVLLALLWNPPLVAALVIITYALLSNLPCIVAQRHTRFRIERVIERAAAAKSMH